MAVRLAMLYGLKCWAIKKLCPKNEVEEMRMLRRYTKGYDK